MVHVPRGRSYHDAREEADALATVRVRNHVAVADGEEGDGDQPHGPQEVAGDILLVVVPAEEGQAAVVKLERVRLGPFADGPPTAVPNFRAGAREPLLRGILRQVFGIGDLGPLWPHRHFCHSGSGVTRVCITPHMTWRGQYPGWWA